jgi:hypothetical protein
LEEEKVPENDYPEDDGDSDDIAKDKPVDLIPKSVLGYHPRIGAPLDLLVDLSIGVVLGRAQSFHIKYGNIGLGMVGAICEATDDVLTSHLGMPVQLDLISPHVLLVAGKRGSGKSYTLGVIAEELAEAMERKEIEVAVVVIDTVDVFRQSIEPNDEQEELLKKWDFEPHGFPAVVYIPRRSYVGLPDEVKEKSRLFPLAISPRELSVSDWAHVLEKGGNLSTTMENLISETLESIRKGYTLETGDSVPLRRDFSIAQMIECIETNPKITELYKVSTRTALIQRLRRADRLGVFHPGGTSAQDLAIAGQITIIDVAPLGSDAEAVLAILSNMLCRQVLTYRMAWTEKGTSAREELPPTWLIIDEAHTLVPRAGNTPARDAIIGYAKLGRRFGCSLVLCTQQPSAIADEAISQADIIISHSLSHDADIRALQQRAPAVMPDSFRDKVFISSLPRGVAIVFDQSTQNKRGFVMRIRPRMSKHGGTDRLSALLEASRLLIPEKHAIEQKVSEERDRLPLPPEHTEPIEQEIELEGLPDVPRPPIKLSSDDWKLLDDWMKDYIQMLFEQQQQEYAITDERAPRDEPKDREQISILEPLQESEGPLTPDLSGIRAREFGILSPSLLSKVMTRKVLYSKISHNFLFTNNPKYRETVVVQRSGIAYENLLNLIVRGLQKLDLRIDKQAQDDSSTFVFLRKNGIRAAFSVGISNETVSVPLVFTGDDKKTLVMLSDEFRSLLT